MMLELQALQSLTKTTNETTSSSVFQQLFTSMLSNTETTEYSNAGNKNSIKIGTLPPTQFIPVSTSSVSKETASTPFSLDEIINQAASIFQLPSKLIQSVIKVESNFNPDAVSTSGAVGLMQLMPGTAKGLGIKNSFNPIENIMGGSKYLRQMLDRFDQNIDLALAAYNAGPGNVEKHHGIPPFKETQSYVQKVKKAYLG